MRLFQEHQNYPMLSMTRSNFPWFYLEHQVHKKDKSFFSHCFFQEEKINSPFYYKVIKPIINVPIIEPIVKDEIFKRFGNRIDLETKRLVYNHLLEIYSQVVYTRSLKKAMIVFPFLLNHVSEIKLSFFKRISVFFKLLTGSFLYLTLKKGYSFLKIKI